MSRQRLRLLWCIAVCSIMAGCAAGSLHLGDRAMDKGDYRAAETHFLQAIEEDDADFRAWRGLGRAQYQRGEYRNAIESFTKATRLNPADAVSAIYLGLAFEREDAYGEAEDVYENFLNAHPKSKSRRQFRSRLLFVQNETMRREIKESLELEAILTSDTSGIKTVAVMPFTIGEAAADSLRPLGRGLAAAVIHDLFKIKSIKVVERLRIQALLDEFELAISGYVDPSSAPRLGRLAGASHLVNSSLSLDSPSKVTVQSGIVDVSDALLRLAITSEEELNEIWRLQRGITFAIIDSLGIKLTKDERRAIEDAPAPSFASFLAFSRGLEEFDRGNYESAREFFRQATEMDPMFEQAAAAQEDSELMSEASVPIEDFEYEIAETFAVEPAEPADLVETVFDVGETEADPRTDDEPAVESGTVTVNGYIP